MEEYKIGSILYTSGGYNRTDVEFYKVIARTANTLTIQPIESIVVDGDPLRTYYVIPDDSKLRIRHYTPKGQYLTVSDSNPFKVNLNKNGVAIIRDNSMSLHIWDGTPQWANTGYAN